MINKSTIEDLVETWVAFQRHTWDAWLDGFGMSRFDPPWEQLRKRSVTLIEELTKRCLRAQTDGAKLAMNWTNGNGGDTLVDQFTHNMREMVDSRTELQQQIYESWFKALRETSPFPSVPFVPKNGNGLTQSWKKVMEETLQAQAGIISALIPKETAKRALAQGKRGGASHGVSGHQQAALHLCRFQGAVAQESRADEETGCEQPAEETGSDKRACFSTYPSFFRRPFSAVHSSRKQPKQGTVMAYDKDRRGVDVSPERTPDAVLHARHPPSSGERPEPIPLALKKGAISLGKADPPICRAYGRTPPSP